VVFIDGETSRADLLAMTVAVLTFPGDPPVAPPLRDRVSLASQGVFSPQEPADLGDVHHGRPLRRSMRRLLIGVWPTTRGREPDSVLNDERVQISHAHPGEPSNLHARQAPLVHPLPYGGRTAGQHARRLPDGQESIHLRPPRNGRPRPSRVITVGRVSAGVSSRRATTTRFGPDGVIETHASPFGDPGVWAGTNEPALAPIVYMGSPITVPGAVRNSGVDDNAAQSRADRSGGLGMSPEGLRRDLRCKLQHRRCEVGHPLGGRMRRDRPSAEPPICRPRRERRDHTDRLGRSCRRRGRGRRHLVAPPTRHP
jgi:hypothetical protein